MGISSHKVKRIKEVGFEAAVIRTQSPTQLPMEDVKKITMQGGEILDHLVLATWTPLTAVQFARSFTMHLVREL